MVTRPNILLHWLIIALCLMGSMHANARDGDDFLRDAQGYLGKGEVSAAIIQLKNALLANPENADARLMLGTTYLQQKEGLSAEKELRHAQQLGVAREDVLLPLGRALLMTGQNGRLLQTITREAGDSGALQVGILLLQGQAYLASGKPALADEKFTAALERQPGLAEALIGKARIAYQNQDRDGATELVNRALSRAPDDADAWILKGELLRLADQPQQALTAFGKAIQLDPGNVQARVGRAAVHLGLNESEQAKADIDWLGKNQSGLYLAHYLKALLLYQQQQLDDALESVQLAIKLAPTHLPSHLLAGTIGYQQERLNQAEQYLRTYWSAAPGNPQAAKLLAATYLKLKQPAKAVEVLQTGLTSASDDAQYLSLLGGAYLGQGDAARGMEYLEQAVALAPDMAGIRTQLAIAQLSLGDTAQGISELRSAVDLDQGLVQADLLLVMVQLQRGEFDQALAAVEALARKMPGSPVPLNLKGAAMLGKQDRPAARQAFADAVALQPDFVPAQINLAHLEAMDGDTEAAEVRYKSVLARDQGNIKALVALATLASRQGNGAASKQWLKQARMHNPQSVEPGLLLLAHYLQQDERKQALDIAQQLLIAHPRHPQVLKSVAQTYFQYGDNEEAARILRSLIEVLPESAEAYYLLGVAKLRLNQLADARISLSRAIELQPDYPAAQLALAQLDIFGKHYDAALKQAADLAQSHPEAAFADELRGDVAVAQKAPEAAAEAYALAYEKAPGAQLARKLYQSHLLTGDTDSALASLQRWLEVHPEDVQSRRLFAQALISAGQNTRALSEYLVVIKYEPASLTALNNIAWLYQEQGNYPEGVKYAERAYRLAPDRPEVADTLGWLLVLNGETNRGLVLLQEARMKAPHIPDIHYHMAAALEKVGRREEARKELNRLLKSNKAFTERKKAEVLQAQLGG